MIWLLVLAAPVAAVALVLGVVIGIAWWENKKLGL